MGAEMPESSFNRHRAFLCSHECNKKMTEIETTARLARARIQKRVAAECAQVSPSFFSQKQPDAKCAAKIQTEEVTALNQCLASEGLL
jgi:hypothetical protein